MYYQSDLTTRFILVVSASCGWLDAATLGIDAEPIPNVLGQPLEITCSYTLTSSETFSKLYIHRVQDYHHITVVSLVMLTYGDRPETLLFSPSVDISGRSKARGSRAERMIQLRLNDTECRDDKSVYECQFVFFYPLPGGTEHSIHASHTVSVTAPPGPMDVMEVDTGPGPPPPDFRVAEGTQINFTCKANLGFPPRPIRWYTTSGGAVTDKLRNLSTRAELVKKVKEECTWVAKSRLSLNLTRAQFGPSVNVRCAADGHSPNRCSASRYKSYCKMHETFTIDQRAESEQGGNENGVHGRDGTTRSSRGGSYSSSDNYLLYLAGGIGALFLVMAFAAVLAYYLFPHFRRRSVPAQEMDASLSAPPGPGAHAMLEGILVRSGELYETHSEETEQNEPSASSQSSGSDESSVESRV